MRNLHVEDGQAQVPSQRCPEPGAKPQETKTSTACVDCSQAGEGRGAFSQHWLVIFPSFIGQASWRLTPPPDIAVSFMIIEMLTNSTHLNPSLLPGSPRRKGCTSQGACCTHIQNYPSHLRNQLLAIWRLEAFWFLFFSKYKMLCLK